MSSTTTTTTTPTNTSKETDFNEDDYHDYDDDQRLIEEFAMLASPIAVGEGEDEAAAWPQTRRRPSRASIDFFQRETSKDVTATGSTNKTPKARRNSFIGQDGKVQDDYITKRANLNKPTKGLLVDTIPMLTDLTTAKSITRIDGNVLAQLFLSGYAKLSTKVEYLNKINVFPIADGDTGANMKVCLKLPSRNLLLDPSPSILRVASNMAADVLLNGQGNSGTILSHFYVTLTEEIREKITTTVDSNGNGDSLSIDEFASCLARAGLKMADAVPNPVEGTLLSVAREACAKLKDEYANLMDLLEAWNDLAQNELAKTPDQLIVDGVKVLEAAGVVDSGAQGFVYTVEGMWLAAQGKLPEAFDPILFKTAVKGGGTDEDLAPIVDHGVCDSKYQFCTEAVILLKDNVTKEQVMDVIGSDSSCGDGSACCGGDVVPIGDSIACVSAPAKEGGNLLKIHIHTNEPQKFFDKLKPFSKDPSIFKKEKVEDMKIMRELEHGGGSGSAGAVDDNTNDSILDNAKFTMIGLCAMALPPMVRSANDSLLFSFPMFMVPADTEEPIDIRYSTDTETLIALNQQRNPSTAVRYTTATSSPMQMKIELLAALAKGKPVLVSIFSTNKKLSAFGRNVLQAIDMLDPDQKRMIKVFVHGWADDGPFLMEAIKCARAGKTIEEAIAVCEDLAERTYGSIGFMSAEHFRKMKAWRPAMYPDGFEIKDGHQAISGTPASIRPNGVSLDERIPMLLAPIGMGDTMVDAFEKAAQHIKNGLEPGQKLGTILIPYVGRPDYGHLFLKILEEAEIEIVGTPYVYSKGMLGVVMGAWGSVSIMYKIMEE